MPHHDCSSAVAAINDRVLAADAISSSVFDAFYRRILPPRPFDWTLDCPADVTRHFPPLVGAGRGHVMQEGTTLRDTLLWLQGRDAEVHPDALRRLNGSGSR